MQIRSFQKVSHNSNVPFRNFIFGRNKDWGTESFFGPTGSQGVTISVRPIGSNLSRAFNLHLSGSDLQANSHSVSHHAVGALNTLSCYLIFITESEQIV